jgi:hypothetical protein
MDMIMQKAKGDKRHYAMYIFFFVSLINLRCNCNSYFTRIGDLEGAFVSHRDIFKEIEDIAESDIDSLDKIKPYIINKFEKITKIEGIQTITSYKYKDKYSMISIYSKIGIEYGYGYGYIQDTAVMDCYDRCITTFLKIDTNTKIGYTKLDDHWYCFTNVSTILENEIPGVYDCTR